MEEIVVETKKRKEIVDITDLIGDLIDKNNFKDGVIHFVVTHTTCALTTADLDPGTDQDMLDAFDKIVPKLDYRHPHDPSHVGDHILSTLIGTSLSLLVKDSSLVLGTWQRVVLVELNGPRKRRIVCTTNTK